jgi:LacI family transcriptional regulator
VPVPKVSGHEGPARQVPTLKDVAQLAGVSLGTASRALNDRAEVSQHTKALVTAAAEKLGYYPNALATGLLRGRSRSIGMLTADINGRFSIPILMGIEDAFGVGEITVMMCESRGDRAREQAHIRRLLGNRVDGLIVVGAIPDSRPSLGRDLPVPVVYAFSPSTDPDDVSVVSDDEQGGRLAAEHLIGQGRTKIAYVSGNPKDEAVHDRISGSRAVLHEHGLEFVADTPVYDRWDEGWGRQMAARLLASAAEVDAVLCGNDTLARGLQEHLIRNGVNVPDDIAVVGFDNWEIVVRHASPSITSIDLSLVEIGRRCATILADMQDTSRPGAVEHVPCTLVVRESSVATVPTNS